MPKIIFCFKLTVYFYEVLQNKSITFLLKATIGFILFCWLSYSLYHQVNRQPNLQEALYGLWHHWDNTKIVWLTITLLLMALNWWFEAKKWQQLLKGTENFTLGQSIQSVLTGLAVSVFTPNRMGEYMGRILYLKNVNKIKGITVTIIGSVAQLIITGFLGLVGLTYYMIYIKAITWLYILWMLSVLLSAGLIYIYYHLEILIRLTEPFPVLRKIRFYLQVVKQFDRQVLNRILLLSLARYVVYSIQFIVLLNMCYVSIPLTQLIPCIWLIFWAMAIVPTIAIVELGVRGETALYFLSPLHVNQVGIISSTWLLWLINLIIPALIGCLFMYRMKFDND